MNRIFKIILGIVFLNVLLFVYCVFAVESYAKNYSEIKADVAIVLGAGLKNGEVSNVFRERLNHAYYLFESNKVTTIIVTGGLSKGEVITDGQTGAYYLEQLGVPNEALLVEGLSSFTFENIQYSKKLMQDFGFNTALIVSDPYHMLRAMKMCQKAGLPAFPSPTQTSAYQSKKVKNKFLLNQAWNLYIYFLFDWIR